MMVSDQEMGSDGNAGSGLCLPPFCFVSTDRCRTLRSGRNNRSFHRELRSGRENRIAGAEPHADPFDFGLTATEIVGRTPWCIHPKGEVEAVPVVGGTKTPTLSKIVAARPDLVVMDKDENPKAVYEWCQAQGFGTFVCHVRHPRDVPDMLRDLGRAVGRPQDAENYAVAIENELDIQPVKGSKTALPLIWHDPLMAANGTTYAGNMLACLGFTVPNIEPEGTGYPEVSPESIIANGDGPLPFERTARIHDGRRPGAARRPCRTKSEPTRCSFH